LTFIWQLLRKAYERKQPWLSRSKSRGDEDSLRVGQMLSYVWFTRDEAEKTSKQAKPYKSVNGRAWDWAILITEQRATKRAFSLTSVGDNIQKFARHRVSSRVCASTGIPIGQMDINAF
jgi:hypothetical protein